MNLKHVLVSIFLCASLVASPTMPWLKNARGPSGSAPAPSYLVNQNFEGTGYDNSESWSETTSSGTVDEDYTGVVLLGSQSLRLNSNEGEVVDTKTSFTAQSTAWAFCLFQPKTWNSSVGDTQFYLADGSNNILAGMFVQNDGTVKFKVNGSSSAASATTLSLDQTYYVWIHYVTSGTCTLYMSTTSTRPSSDGSGAVVLTGTAAATNTSKVILYNGYFGGQFIFDKVLVSGSEIGNNP